MRLFLLLLCLCASSGCMLDRRGVQLVDDGGRPRRDGTTTRCTAADDHCETDLLLTCGADGMFASTDCAAMGAFCMNAACSPWVCTPLAGQCSTDLSSVLSCDARGMAQSTQPCPLGCDPTTNSCRGETPCSRPVAGNITPGMTLPLNLCGAGNDENYIALGGDGCLAMTFPANGEDVIVRLQILTAGNYAIDLVDVDPGAVIDTTVYLRTVCSDPNTQFGCEDDISSVDTNSHLESLLEPGDYFVVVDSFDIDVTNGTDCGQVALTVSAL